MSTTSRLGRVELDHLGRVELHHQRRQSCQPTCDRWNKQTPEHQINQMDLSKIEMYFFTGGGQIYIFDNFQQYKTVVTGILNYVLNSSLYLCAGADG